MKKRMKRLAILFAVLLLLAALLLAAWVFFLFPYFDPNRSEVAESPVGPVKIAEKSEYVDFDSESGILYVNNEVVVFFRASASKEEIDAMIREYEAEADDSMADIGVYKLIFSEAMSYEELEALVESIKSSSIVEDVYVNPVMELQNDTAEADDEFEYQEAVYPSDGWDGDTWDTAVPGGANWGMEAINAPGAWGYLDRMTSVNIGLIDSMPDTGHGDLTFSDSKCLFIDEATGLTSVNTEQISADDHGTHVSGIMGAEWDNGVGAAGVMGNKGELYYSAVYYDSNGTITTKYGTAYSYLLALKTLIDQDVRAINISQNTSRLVGFAASHGNQNAVNYLTLQANLAERGLNRIITAREQAGKSDFVICVAAGNSNSTYYYKDDKQAYGYREEMTRWEKIKYVFGWRGEVGGSLALYNNFLNLMSAESVRNRVIVVGSVGIDQSHSTSSHTQYTYSYFSNVGNRVDVVAPGEDIYSTTAAGAYARMSGTSMATPHVTGVAGLIFASNPELTGPDVKRILLASTKGRYYYDGGYSGLLYAETAVVNALKTKDSRVAQVLGTETGDGLDLCFVIDTTASMGDDIDNAKANMTEILEHLSEKTANYRVAMIDYRDFSSRTGASEDYAYRVQLSFTSSREAIVSAINELSLGDGGDTEETVYSALMAAIGLNWREDAKKAIILLGDAAPLDPEPKTDYTYDQVLLALFNADISLDYEDSDSRVTDSIDDYLINIFSIGANASDSAADFFEKLSKDTGGSYADVDDASKVSDAIIDSIEKIEVVNKNRVTVDFGADMADEIIYLYDENDYLFAFHTDEEGKFVLDEMEAGAYRWACNHMYGGGTIGVQDGVSRADIQTTKEYWFAPVLKFWYDNKMQILAGIAGCVALCILIPSLLYAVMKRKRKRAAERGQTVRHCQSCGTELVEGARFCNQCGSRVKRRGKRSKKEAGA